MAVGLIVGLSVGLTRSHVTLQRADRARPRLLPTCLPLPALHRTRGSALPVRMKAEAGKISGCRTSSSQCTTTWRWSRWWRRTRTPAAWYLHQRDHSPGTCGYISGETQDHFKLPVLRRPSGEQFKSGSASNIRSRVCGGGSRRRACAQRWPRSLPPDPGVRRLAERLAVILQNDIRGERTNQVK